MERLLPKPRSRLRIRKVKQDVKSNHKPHIVKRVNQRDLIDSSKDWTEASIVLFSDLPCGDGSLVFPQISVSPDFC